MANFDNFAGQLVPSGVRKNSPVVNFESVSDRTVYNNLVSINNLTPKLSRVFIRDTRVYSSPLERCFRKTTLPYGVGFEEAEFKTGTANKKTSGACIQLGNPELASQINMINYAWNNPVSIYDREINKAVLTPEEVGSYFANKMRTPLKTMAMEKYQASLTLISDVIDGTRTIQSKTQSDGQGEDVTYNATISGYAGQVVDTDIVLPELTIGTTPAFSDGADALKFVKMIENTATEMREESSHYSKLQIETFVLDKPYLIMESKTLNALDNAWAMDGSDKRIPTRTAREFLRTYTDIVEIPSGFKSLPTNTQYSTNRLGAVLIDKDSMTEALVFENVESQRCASERMTMFSFAGESSLSIYKGNPCCAFLFDKS